MGKLIGLVLSLSVVAQGAPYKYTEVFSCVSKDGQSNLSVTKYYEQASGAAGHLKIDASASVIYQGTRITAHQVMTNHAYFDRGDNPAIPGRGYTPPRFFIQDGDGNVIRSSVDPSLYPISFLKMKLKTGDAANPILEFEAQVDIQSLAAIVVMDPNHYFLTTCTKNY